MSLFKETIMSVLIASQATQAHTDVIGPLPAAGGVQGYSPSMLPPPGIQLEAGGAAGAGGGGMGGLQTPVISNALVSS